MDEEVAFLGSGENQRDGSEEPTIYRARLALSPASPYGKPFFFGMGNVICRFNTNGEKDKKVRSPRSIQDPTHPYGWLYQPAISGQLPQISKSLEILNKISSIIHGPSPIQFRQVHIFFLWC